MCPNLIVRCSLFFSPGSSVRNCFSLVSFTKQPGYCQAPFWDTFWKSRAFVERNKWEGPILLLSEAFLETFSTRGTNIQPEPIALTNSFAKDTAKAAQWRGFIRKNRLKNVPQNLMEVVTTIAAFLRPIAEQLAASPPFKGTWKAPGPWRE